jgi:hypothetical protein
MAGGTWVTQNKVRPGVYINFASEPQAVGALGERGVTSLALTLPWGAPKTIVTIEAGEDTQLKLGYAITAPELMLVREALKRARAVLLYRLNTGTPAAVTVAPLTVTAKYGGVRGNDLTIVVQENVDDDQLYDVITLLAGVEVDSQTVANIAGLTSNDYVVFSGTGALVETAGAPLIGGANGTIANQDYADYLGALELHDFNTAAYTGTDAGVKALYSAYARRLREDEGKKVQVVMENYPTADYEGVISVKNGVILADGSTLTAAQATAWVAGATAGANVNQSLTYAAYDDAVDVSPRYTNSQIIAALQAGEFLFTPGNGVAQVEQDINTLTSFIPGEKGKQFSKNRVIRALDSIGNDIRRIFESFYIGKVNNNADGRNLLKNEINTYLDNLQNVNAIQNFDSQADVVVQAGQEVDSVYVEANIQPVDSIEKIYMLVRVR